MRTIRALNHFFIAEEGEPVHYSDYLLFYGQYALFTGITAFTLIAVL